ncbi:sensor histidine kinase [Leptothrix discophora]|uniref:histidine kinase n=1 Tax=Leptothrix discophora TaxID=89 RepID=A0ABT9G6S5_LEPDI|nr:HAMP domain-containing sensor histidine kinase [Leptothrix discophora]MDP4301893.1 HAMP domain-containing sensor histidine kinase [Leptothrix discophora]
MSEHPAAYSLEGLLRRRVLLLIGTLWLIASAAAFYGLREKARILLDDTLLEAAEQLLAMPEAALGQGEAPPRVLEIGGDETDIAYQVFDGTGTLRLRSHAAPVEPLVLTDSEGLVENTQWYALVVKHPDRTRRVIVAQARAERQATLWSVYAWLLGPLLLVLPLSAWMLHHVLRRSFLTLEPVRADLSSRAPHQLHPVEPNHVPQELQPMLETVNMLMARVSKLIEAERAFAAHTAHELRTPLAAARAQAQRLAQEAQEHGVPRLAERTQALVRQLDRLTRLASRLLQLARIDSGVALRREPIDLSQLAGLVMDEFGEARAHGQLDIHVESQPLEAVDGDIDALGIALRNLIDNALKHGGSGARVRICVGPGRLAVQDNGPGIPTDQVSRLALPFERGSTVAEGSGLGLTMVQTVARQSGAVLRFTPLSGPDWRFEVSLSFPVAIAAPSDAGSAASTPERVSSGA